MKAAFLTSILILTGCASGNCRQLERGTMDAPAPGAPPAAGGSTATTGSTPGAAPVAGAPAKPSVKATPAASPTAASKATTVVVYKDDGSLQCSMGKPISVEQMEKELKGIKVLAREKKPDGRMHAQACGMSSGIVNAYTIPVSSLPEAEKRGFKKLVTE